MRVKAVSLLLTLFFLVGCSGNNEPMDRALMLRNEILESNGCSFHGTITADYGEQIYIFEMDCRTDKDGNLSFTVTKPDTICGITGNISATGGALTFDDKVLAFQDMADGQITPVTSPWIFVTALKGGYLKSCADVGGGLEIEIDDSYRDDALQVIVTTEDITPISAEIFWKARRILTICVDDFQYL